MITEIFVSAGVIGASDDMRFLAQLPGAHALQRNGDRRGSHMPERQVGAFVSEHKIGETDIHVREEYTLGGFHRFYVMTGSERVRDAADFFEFASLNFK